MAMFGRSSNGKDMTEIPRSDIWGHEAGVSNKKMLHDWFYTRMYVLYCSGLHCIAWHCIAWHCVVVLYCITMQCNATYCMYVRLHMFVSHLSPQRIPRKLHLIILLVLYMYIYIHMFFSKTTTQQTLLGYLHHSRVNTHKFHMVKLSITVFSRYINRKDIAK